MTKPSRQTAARAAALLLTVLASAAHAQTTAELEAGFRHPPAEARPRVWWHWMNGNISEAGIKLDLEWMHRVGLGGFQTFDAALATPQVVDHRLSYMTPEWKKAFLYATTLGEQLGMEEAIASSPGWSETGGPWVKPADGMKKYVWSELRVAGAKALPGPLPHPPETTGPFQSVPLSDRMSAASDGGVHFYADGTVLAFRPPASDIPLAALEPILRASAGTPDFTKLVDGDLSSAIELPMPARGAPDAWIEFGFTHATTIRGLQFSVKSFDEITAFQNGFSNPDLVLSVADDGKTFRNVVKASLDGSPEQTLSFPPVAGKLFRVSFQQTPLPPPPYWLIGLDVAALGYKPTPKATSYKVAELKLLPGARVNHFEGKAAFTLASDLEEAPTPESAPVDVVARSGIVDLTTKLRPDGTLDWTPPAGDWVILRFGYTLTGITNHPATREATGLEVDKLDRPAVKRYMDRYLDSYRDAVGADNMGKRGIQAVVTDSWEAGPQNWTPTLLDEFERRRGYDARPWMPALAGFVVESARATDGFLWDFRKTIQDLHADAEYRQVQESLAARGLKHYGESHEVGRAMIADGMEVKKLDDIPMSAMWVQTPGVNRPQFGFDADDRESASVAHIYGRRFVAAESLTASAAPWQWSPSTLRPVADQELINGINRFVIHESSHQPIAVGKAPGLTLGPFGQWFNRNETWAEEAGPWIDYLARGSYLMQQGHYAADILYFYGEDSNLTAIFDKSAPAVPEGYGFDYTNADALLHDFRVRDGRIVTASGMDYRLLVLDPHAVHMSLPVLRAIRGLVGQGAVVVGPRPTDDASLADDAGAFKTISQELFGDGTGVHTVGQGKVFAGQTPARVLQELALTPDFTYTRPSRDTQLEFSHRRLPEGEIYFVANRNPSAQEVTASFRTAGRAPALWHADSGRIEFTPFTTSPGITQVPLKLEPWGSVFVVFTAKSQATDNVAMELPERELAVLEGTWSVTYQAGRGAPPAVELPKLASWTDQEDAGIKYFSGTAIYRKTINVPQAWLASGHLVSLDLGEVRELAHVTVNGHDLGTVWHAPFAVDVTNALRPGANEIVVRVTNTWVNRLIGDMQPGAQKYSYADVQPYKASSPLLPSGLLGPVRLLSR